MSANQEMMPRRPEPSAVGPLLAHNRTSCPRMSPAHHAGLLCRSPYGTNVGLVDGSHTSLDVATSSFMLLHVRRPGIDGCPSTTERA